MMQLISGRYHADRSLVMKEAWRAMALICSRSLSSIMSVGRASRNSSSSSSSVRAARTCQCNRSPTATTSDATSLTWSLPVRLQGAGRLQGHTPHCLLQPLLLFALLLGGVLLLHLAVPHLVVQLHAAGLQKAAEGGTAL